MNSRNAKLFGLCITRDFSRFQIEWISKLFCKIVNPLVYVINIQLIGDITELVFTSSGKVLFFYDDSQTHRKLL